MKKFLLILILLGIAGFGVYDIKNKSKILIKENNNRRETINLSPTVFKRKEISKQAIFIPYWSEFGELNRSSYDRYIYFGITANYQGINQSEAGGLKLDQFVEATAGRETWLTLRLLNDDFNKDLLKDEALQQKIIGQILTLLKEKKFTGVVLDLELFSLFDNVLTDQINRFAEKFYTSVKSNYKSFALTIYGDNFYRKRPFDLAFLSKNSDEIMVMAYDFHKSRGEPGPNFPLARRSGNEGGPEIQTYNYDFKTMIKDFSQIVPIEKLTIIYGMFGYDWTVDEKKRPFTQAKALTLAEIRKQFLDNCDWKDCIIKTDELSKETEINYTVSSDSPDEQGIYRIDYHIIWFEDEESVKVKTEYLKEQGIGSIGYWAWGYF